MTGCTNGGGVEPVVEARPFFPRAFVHMEKREQQAFREPLDALIEELEAQLEQADASDDSIAPDNAIGRLTRMEAIQAQSMSAAARREKKRRLYRARRALERIDKGTYGACVECGQEIPAGRLEIMPEAPYCVQCAARKR